MTVKKITKMAAPAAKSALKAKKAEAPSKKPAAKAKAAGAKTVKSAVKSAAPAKRRAPAAKKAPAKSKAPAAKSKKRAPKVEPEAAHRIATGFDLAGSVTSGEGRTDLGDADSQAHEAQAEIDALQKATPIESSEAILEAGPGMGAAQAAMEARAWPETEDKAPAGTESGENEETEPAAEWRETAKREPAKLERLQKILSAAGIASRRSAEEMIVAGRVMVNGQVVTQLGSKADAAHDHIRVDGKLLHGAERHRYFMLNKPRGYVTTMSDPEGRPTVMEFFAGARERVYPVGRLDYLSEGLLLMTNDGELANLLTKAGSGVEKTYLVKVAGEPTAEQLERLRGGVAIEKGEPGSQRVRTAPARIRQVREGDNPWFEVALIEGRNRELRKMFSAIGHFAEKIRRVSYGPLVLDVEPGKMRELDEDEVGALRLTAEGKISRVALRARSCCRVRRACRRSDALRNLAAEAARLLVVAPIHVSIGRRDGPSVAIGRCKDRARPLTSRAGIGNTADQRKSGARAARSLVAKRAIVRHFARLRDRNVVKIASAAHNADHSNPAASGRSFVPLHGRTAAKGPSAARNVDPSNLAPNGRNGSGIAKPSRALRSSESRGLKGARVLAAANRGHRSAASRASVASQAGPANTAETLVAARSVVLRGPAHRAADGSAGKRGSVPSHVSRARPFDRLTAGCGAPGT